MKNDDRMISAYLERLNFSFYNGTNRFFVGHRFANFTSAYEAVTSKKIKNCSVMVPKSRKGCRAYYTRLSELAFWHDRTSFKDFIGRIDEIRRLAGKHIYFYVINNRPVVCRYEAEDLSGYYD
jgi:hypothetical protein